MNKKQIKDFFRNIQNLNLSYSEQIRMMALVQVRGSNRKNKAMSYKELMYHLSENKGNIISLALGPDWNRLVFVDLDIEV